MTPEQHIARIRAWDWRGNEPVERRHALAVCDAYEALAEAARLVLHWWETDEGDAVQAFHAVRSALGETTS